MIAACGTTTASLIVRTFIATSRKAPGHNFASRFANTALTFTEPDDASIALSTNCNLPCNVAPLSGNTAVTTEPPPFKACNASARWRCGRLKPTAIGSSWVMLTSAVWFACTELPGNTLMAPARPALGALIRAFDSATRAASSAARSALISASCESTRVWFASTAPCDTKPCASRSRLRASWRCASARPTSSLASWARAFATFASSVRASSVNSTSPALTNWPSRICTLVTTLVTCGRISTLDNGRTVPVALSTTAMSRCCARTVVTVTGGADAARAAVVAKEGTEFACEDGEPDAAPAVGSAPPPAPPHAPTRAAMNNTAKNDGGAGERVRVRQQRV